jgi:hypothetical protein
MRDYALDLEARWDANLENDLDSTLEFLAFAEGRFLSVHPFPELRQPLPRTMISPRLTPDYTSFPAEVRGRIQSARAEAGRAGHCELVMLYWDI